MISSGYSNHFWLRELNVTTPKLRVLREVVQLVESRGYPPSVRELAGLLQKKSHSSIHRHLDDLHHHGYLDRRNKVARAWWPTDKSRKLVRSTRAA